MDHDGELNHIVALSGGDDSTAMALRLAEVEPRSYIYVCTPTGDELPDMIEHWRLLGNLLDRPILPVTTGISLQGLVRREKCLPNERMRFCTRHLKVKPYQRWLRDHLPCISYVGLRADEPERNGIDFTSDLEDISIRYPLREWGWGEGDVFAYLDARGIRIPARTDCARCYHQTLGEWWRLWKLYPELYADAEWQELEISKLRGKQVTFRSASRDNWPASLSELRETFEANRVPPRTTRQEDLFLGGARRVTTQCRACTL